MAWRWNATAMASRRPVRRHLTFRIFNEGVRPRLDANGRPLPCSNCRTPARECALETFCDFCIATFKHERKREAKVPEWQKQLCLNDAGSIVTPRCTRCHSEVEDDAREAALDHVDFPALEVWCLSCIRHWVNKDLQLELDLPRNERKLDERIWRRIWWQRHCQRCGGGLMSRTAKQCRSCARKQPRRGPHSLSTPDYGATARTEA